jgi:hypothetical protein
LQRIFQNARLQHVSGYLRSGGLLATHSLELRWPVPPVWISRQVPRRGRFDMTAVNARRTIINFETRSYWE